MLRVQTLAFKFHEGIFNPGGFRLSINRFFLNLKLETMKKLILLLVGVTITLSTFSQLNTGLLQEISISGIESQKLEIRRTTESQIFYEEKIVVDLEKKITMIYGQYTKEDFKKCKSFLKTKGRLSSVDGGFEVWEGNMLWRVSKSNNLLMLSYQEWSN
jgi:hypothetical protein